MKASIVIATYQRWGALLQTLPSVLARMDGDCELIIVDQTPISQQMPDGLRTLLAESVAQYFRVTPASLPAARNFGVDVSNGEIVIFVDDDVRIHPNFVEMHLREYSDPDVIGVAGRVILSEGESAPSGPMYTSDGRFIGGHSFEMWTVANAPMGCNMSFRRERILSVGGFDTGFVKNAFREESDIALRMLESGGRIVFSPAACLLHLPDPSGGCRDEHLLETPAYYRNQLLFLLRHFPAHCFLRFYEDLLVPHLIPFKRQPKKFVRRSMAIMSGFFQALNASVFKAKLTQSIVGSVQEPNGSLALEGRLAARR